MNGRELMNFTTIVARLALTLTLLTATGCGSLLRSVLRGAEPASQACDPPPEPAPDAG